MYRLSPVFCCTGSVRLSRLLVQGGRESGSTFRSRHSRIHRPANTFTHSHSLQQLRARKGGARGGKAGFATLSAFPLVPAHAKMVPLKGKNAYASSILPGKEKAYASSILPGKEKVYASSILPGKEKSTPLVSPPERRCPPHPGALAGRHQASVSS